VVSNKEKDVVSIELKDGTLKYIPPDNSEQSILLLIRL